MNISSNCHLIGILGGKGGVGKSVFAANFAVALKLELRASVLLIDADARSCGDQNVILGIKPLKTLSEIADFQGSLSSQTITQLVTPHSSGINYIGAVRSPDEQLNVNVKLFLSKLEFLSRFHQFIIVDLGNDLLDLQKELLLESTTSIIVTVPEVLVINQTQRLIHQLLTETFPLDMFQLVINKYSQGSIATQAVAQALRVNPIGILPLDEVTTMSSLQRSTPFVLTQNRTPLAASFYDLVRKITSGPLQKLKNIQKPKLNKIYENTSTNTANTNLNSGGGEVLDPLTVLKLRVHNELIKAMDLKKGITDTQGDPKKEKELRQKTLQSITLLVDKESSGLPRDERGKIIKEVLEEALGLGPLEDLLSDSTVTEIMVNGHKKIFIEKSGRIQLSPVTFTSNLHLRNVIERIITPLGRRIDEKTPYVDARLKDGSRVNAIIEPLAIDGPSMTIRKFKKGGISQEQYMQLGTMTKSMIDFLKICVQNGLNIVVSGGTGSGKTSLLNMLSSNIPTHERVITVEDAAELQLQQEHVVRLESRPANMEGTGAVSIRDLIRNALRMRPDRIIVGECRDGAALDMLQAMNTGHDGSMTTTHANTPRECISRLETLCMMAGMDLPIRAIRDQIASAVNIIVQISRLSDGSRKITSITEVCGMQGDTVTLQEIFYFKETGFDKNKRILGAFQTQGLIPTFISKLEQKGVYIPRDMFTNDPNKSMPKGASSFSAAAPSAPSVPSVPPPSTPHAPHPSSHVPPPPHMSHFQTQTQNPSLITPTAPTKKTGTGGSSS